MSGHPTYRMLGALLFVMLALAPMAGQTVQASVAGTVIDSTGGFLPGATVDLVDPATNQHRTTVTDDRGTFRIASLPPGVYDLRVGLNGFAPHVHPGIALAIGATVRLTISMSPASLADTVTVTAQPPALDASRTTAATIVDPERIEELPVRGRDYLHFVLLAPGITPSSPAGRSAAASPLPDSGFSFAGLRPRSNQLTIDGLHNNDEYSGGSRTELSLETIREFQVASNGGSAAHGGSAGGAIDVVTKSGANILHGDAFLFGQSGRLDARPALEETLDGKPDLTRYRAGLAVGGPLVADRTFYYAAGEYESTRGQEASDIAPATTAALNGTLDAGAAPALDTQRLTTGLFGTGLRETEFSTRVTHQLSVRQSLMARFAATDTRETGDGFHTGGLVDASARGTSQTRDLAVTTTWTTIVGKHMTNEVRAQVAGRRVNLRTGDRVGPGILIPGVAEFGRPYAGNSRHDQRYAEVGDTLGGAKGNHLVQAGGDVTDIRITGVDTDGAGGTYLFRSLGALAAGQPESYRQVFGNSDVAFSARRVGAFAEDHWTPRPALTVDLGLRLDAEALPAALGVTNHVIGPRASLAWVPHTGWIIRGGAGVYADRLVLAAFEPALTADGTRAFEQVVTGPTAAAVFATRRGGSLQGPLSAVAPSINTVRPGRWDPASRQVSVGVEHGLAPDLTVSAGYLFVRGHDLSRTVNVNLAPPTVLTPGNAGSLGVATPDPQQIGRPVFDATRPNGAYGDIFELQPTASSTYHGITASVNRRLAHEIEWSASYTWSHAADTASDFDEAPQNPYAPGDESSASRYDRRHRLVSSALFDLPIGDEEDRKPGETPGFWVRVFSQIEVAPILTIASGSPVNPLTGGDESQTHTAVLSARPLGRARNSLRLPATATLDLRVLKAIAVKPHGKLDLVFEMFNVFNRVNVTEINAVYGGGTTPVVTFGRPVGAGAPRQLQFSIDFEF